ncbi:NADP-dependent oxidoreductase domain-containing protein [Fusarium acuminatum]|uniref:NADP-dependent oxidoreductase domain-containing protein n=1 Tax=Fusarium acuminatum TaxID=5515 RepID=A0ABZ2X6W5_9HYPO
MPAIGLGTWRSDRSQVSKAVETALRAGYRHIDTALAYGNEREVGAGIRASQVPREEIWVSSKLRNNWHKHARQCVDKSLRNLGLDYFDIKSGGVCYKDWDYVDTWVEMQKLVDEDKVCNIGVSNFGIQHLEKLLNSPSTDLVAYNTSRGIHTEAYSYLGSAHSVLYRNEALLNIAEAKKKAPQQVLLQWGLQKGWSVVPKSVTPSRIESNLDLDGWELSDNEIAELDGIKEQFKVVNDGFLPIKVFFGDDE